MNGAYRYPALDARGVVCIAEAAARITHDRPARAPFARMRVWGPQRGVWRVVWRCAYAHAHDCAALLAARSLFPFSLRAAAALSAEGGVYCPSGVPRAPGCLDGLPSLYALQLLCLWGQGRRGSVP